MYPKFEYCVISENLSDDPSEPLYVVTIGHDGLSAHTRLCAETEEEALALVPERFRRGLRRPTDEDEADGDVLWIAEIPA